MPFIIFYSKIWYSNLQKKTHKGYANFLFYFMGYVSKRRLRTGAQYTPFKTGVSNRHFTGNMRPANMICVALNDFQNEQISQNNKFFIWFTQSCGPLTLNMYFVRLARPHFFTMWPLKTFEFETPDLKSDELQIKRNNKRYINQSAVVWKRVFDGRADAKTSFLSLTSLFRLVFAQTRRQSYKINFVL